MKRNTRKITIRVTPQTLYHLEQLAAWNGYHAGHQKSSPRKAGASNKVYREIGHVVDKLMREKILCRTLKKQPAESGRMQCGMLELRVIAKPEGSRNSKQTG